MKPEEIHVTSSPELRTCTSNLQWDDEANILIATISYTPTSEPSVYPMQRQVNQAVGIVEPQYTVFVSALEISLDADKSPLSIELRMNPAQWQRAEAPALDAHTEADRLHILAAYDSNNIASIDAALVVSWDQPGSTLSVCLPEADRSTRWYQLGRHLAFGVTSQSALAEIRFLDLTRTALLSPKP